MTDFREEADINLARRFVDAIEKSKATEASFVEFEPSAFGKIVGSNTIQLFVVEDIESRKDGNALSRHARFLMEGKVLLKDHDATVYKIVAAALDKSALPVAVTVAGSGLVSVITKIGAISALTGLGLVGGGVLAGGIVVFGSTWLKLKAQRLVLDARRLELFAKRLGAIHV